MAAPSFKSFVYKFVALLAIFLAGSMAFAFRAPDNPGKPNFDIRLPVDFDESGGFVFRSPSPTQLFFAEALRQQIPGLILRWDGMSGSVKWIAAPAVSSLSAPMSGKPEDVARAFLKHNAILFGLNQREVEQLEATGAVPTPDGGANVYFKQRIARFEVWGGRAMVRVKPDGSIPFMGSSLYANMTVSSAPSIEAVEAVRQAVRDVYPGLLFIGNLLTAEKDGERYSLFDDPGFGRSPQARLVLFPECNESRLAWEVRVAETTLETDYRILVDALDAKILFRTNMTRYATAKILNAGYPDPETEEEDPLQYQVQTIPSSTLESPLGWITGSGTDLTGNNASSHLYYWTEPGLSDSTGTYEYPYNTITGALANAWWWANDFHDKVYAAGFDEAAGNYQDDNFGSGGSGGDPIAVVSWSVGGRNNAFYTTSADGDLSTINFFWVSCSFCGDHDEYPENGGERGTGFMREVVVHEYAHGVTTRMVGGPADDTCLGGRQSGAMGEGWSDIFAESFYGDLRLGGHFYEGAGWMRDPRQDLTYDNLCGVGDYGCQVHDDGLIWSATLWELRESMRALDTTSGLDAFHEILVNGLANTICYPTYIDARDGILQADTDLYSSSHHGIIWNVFANRGMGEVASSTGENDTSPTTSYTVPSAYVCTVPDTPTDLSVSPTGDNALTLTYSSSGISAIEIWRDDLDNPLDSYSRIGFTDNLSTYVDDTVQGGKSYAYQVVALGDGGLNCRSAPSSSDSATATGSCSAGFPIFDPELAISDGASNCALTLSWNPASQSCPGFSEPVVYNVYRGPTPGFEPSDKFLIGQTISTTYQDIPPSDGNVSYYLVLAQHGTLNDPPDHQDRGATQAMQWIPRIPTLGRTTAYFWDFESGASGWTTDNSDDPDGGWTLVDPISTEYGGALLAPETAAGGTGQAWVTGDTGSIPSSITESDSDGRNYLYSPDFDGTEGRTILSFDYWIHIKGNSGNLKVEVSSSGQDPVLPTIVKYHTIQDFDTPSEHSWQRAEIDLSSVITPSSTMSVAFYSNPNDPFAEFGIDNIRIEQATVCSRTGLFIDSVSIDDSSPGWGNNNGILEPGETARLDIILRNDGTSTAVNPEGTLTSASSSVQIHDAASSFPDIGTGSTGASTGPGFTVTMPDTSCGETLEFRFQFTDDSGVTSYDSWTVEFGNLVTDIVFQDNFETDKGWTTEGAGSGQGLWERGDPVGTTDGSNQANPENDSPNDANSQCYVTENGPISGNENDHDVDSTSAELYSPRFDLTGYKRARMSFDLWYYDNSSDDYWQDYSFYLAYVDDAFLEYYWNNWYQGASTNGWKPKSIDLTGTVPMVNNIQLYLSVIDRDESHYSSAVDNVVEMGIDNVKVEGDRQECLSHGITNPPNGVGSTLMVDKSGSVDIFWNASPIDGTHDGAAYYELFVSGSPSGGFALNDTTTQTDISRSLDESIEYYKITAVNAAGTSGDEPTP
jgi:extracellular elastinolytic metalloproteinase